MKQLTFEAQRKMLHDSYDNKKQRKKTCDLVQGPRFINFVREDELEAYRRTLYPMGCGKLFPVGWAGNSMVRCGANLKELNGSTSLLQCEECQGKNPSVN